MLLWCLHSGCPDEDHLIDAGYIWTALKHCAEEQLDVWLDNGGNLTLIVYVRLTLWVLAAVAEIKADQDYRFRLLDKTGTATKLMAPEVPAFQPRKPLRAVTFMGRRG